MLRDRNPQIFVISLKISQRKYLTLKDLTRVGRIPSDIISLRGRIWWSYSRSCSYTVSLSFVSFTFVLRCTRIFRTTHCFIVTLDLGLRSMTSNRLDVKDINLSSIRWTFVWRSSDSFRISPRSLCQSSVIEGSWIILIRKLRSCIERSTISSNVIVDDRFHFENIMSVQNAGSDPVATNCNLQRYTFCYRLRTKQFHESWSPKRDSEIFFLQSAPDTFVQNWLVYGVYSLSSCPKLWIQNHLNG